MFIENNYKFRGWYAERSEFSTVACHDQIHRLKRKDGLVFQQWSGWYDSNNIEIYQGDLIEDLVVSNCDGYGLGEIIYDIKRGVWKVKYHNEETNHTIYKFFLDFLGREKSLITIVGNIFEGVKSK